MSQTFKKLTTPSRLFCFALPSIAMMMIFSLYCIIDGLFVSNYVSTDALGAINIVYPVINIGLGISIMIAAGGSAIIAKKLGVGKKREANSIFTFLTVISVCIALLCLAVGSFFIENIVTFLGATTRQFEMAQDYLQIHFYFIVFFYLQNAFQILFVTAGKPVLGLLTTLLAGIANVAFDYLFIVVLDFGISGAALATGISYLIPTFVGIIFFTFNKKAEIRFTKFKPSLSILKESMLNGSSEMLSNVANAVTTFLLNYQFLRFYQEDGVAAITIVLYFQFLISAAFFGYAQGIAPIISYKYGTKNIKELKKIKKYSLWTTSFLGALGFFISLILIYPVAKVFCGGNANVYSIVVEHFWLFSFSFVLMGISTFASSWFTALGDGKSSAIISFLRTLVFFSLAIMLTPILFKEAGLWFSISIAEGLGFITAILFLTLKKKRINNLILTNQKQ